MENEKRRGTEKIAFSIGTKLVLITSLIVLVSLGSITALVSWLVREDLRVLAEETNFEANRRSAMEAEYFISKMRSDSLTLIYIITAMGSESDIARRTMEFFFSQNPQVAALFFSYPRGEDELFINQRFFLSADIESSLAEWYHERNSVLLMRAALGETMLRNATPYFAVSLTALFFPWQSGGGAILFSPETIENTFGLGLNQSYLINDAGTIVIHPDFDLMRYGMNVADRDFIREITESDARSRQILVYSDFGFDPSRIMPAANPFQHIIDRVVPVYYRARDAVFGFLHIDVPPARADGPETVRKFLAYTKLGVGGSTVITTIEYDMVFEGIVATTRRNIYLTVAVLFFSIVVIWFFAKTISVPLKMLAAAARSIESGMFELDLKHSGRDEIGVLTSSFRKMCTALGIFGRFTNRDIAVRAMRGEIKPGGLPKHATIFFSDIRGFTAKSENFTNVFGDEASNRIVYWLNNYLAAMVECVEKTGGAVDKFIGDAVMAHWGTAYTAGSPQKDAFNCVTAALMMRKAVHEMNKKRKANDPGNPEITIGCGINTGIVTTGQIGSDMRMEYTVIGDPVNLASRVESLNKPLGTDILIAEDTWNLVKNYFRTEEMPPVTVKGKEKPVRIFAVINLAGIDKGPQSLADLRKLLNIKAPDIAAADVNEGEKKYAIGGTTGGKTGEKTKQEKT